MKRIKMLLLASALAVGLVVLLNPVIPVIRVVQAQNVNCAGSFTPNFNCIINGIWLFANGFTSSGGVLYNTATVTLTNGQTLALNNTPFTIVPAPPQGYVAVVTYGVASFSYVGTYGAGSDLKLYYSSTGRVGGNAASGTITFAGFLDTAASNNEVFTGTIAGVEPGKNPQPIVLEQTTPTAMTGGNASNRLTIFVQYILTPVGALP